MTGRQDLLQHFVQDWVCVSARPADPAEYFERVERVLDETSLQKWSKVCRSITSVWGQDAGKGAGADSYTRWVHSTLQQEEARYFRDVDPVVRYDLQQRLVSMLPGSQTWDFVTPRKRRRDAAGWADPFEGKRLRIAERADLSRMDAGATPYRPAPQQVSLFDDDEDEEDEAPPARGASQRSDDQQQSQGGSQQLRHEVRVECPAYPMMSGVYLLQRGACNGCHMWAYTPPPSAQHRDTWFLFSSPQGLWTISNRESDCAQGNGVVAGVEPHGGYPPYDESFSYQYATRQGTWRDDPNIKISPAGASSKGRQQPPQQQQQQQAPPAQDIDAQLHRFLNNEGYLTRKGCGRLVRWMRKDMTHPSPSHATWQKMCGIVGAAQPEAGMTLPQVRTLLQQQRREQKGPAGRAAPAQGAAGGSGAASNAQRCGRCRACLNPGWKKACEARGSGGGGGGAVRAAPAKARPAPATARAAAPTTDLVADLIGADPPAKKKPAAKRSAAGYAPGVRLVDAVASRQ